MASKMTKTINSIYHPTYYSGGTPLYGLGSWIKDKALPFGFDAAKLMADNALSVMGAPDVIGENDYKNNLFSDLSGVTNKVNQIGGGIALGMAGLGSLQDVGAGFNPMTEESQYMPYMAMGGNMPTFNKELAVGKKVEMEHKPTLDFIKKHYKEKGKFPTAKQVAKSITVDHLKDFKKIDKMGRATEQTYYKGLVNNNLSDELEKYANGGPLDVSNKQLEAVRQMMAGGLLNSLAGGGGIHIDPSKKGTFTAAATKHGKGVQEFARQVLGNKENYSPSMVKKANFARNASKWHEMGGSIENGGTHQQNPLGGVPIGNNALVEEGEYIWEGPKGKYVFSNRF